MEDVLLLENPRRRRRATRARPRRAVRRRRAAPRARRKVRRRRRRNPIVPAIALANPRRRRRGRKRAVRRRRRRNPTTGGRVLNMRRAMGIVQDGAGLAFSEFAGDLAARWVTQKTPVGAWIRDMVPMAAGQEKWWVQLALAVLTGPMLRRFRVVPRPIIKYWEVSNAASALIGLTYAFRQQALTATGLGDMHEYPSGGISDWVTSAPAPARIAPTTIDGLSDWATVGGSASYTGDPFSM